MQVVVVLALLALLVQKGSGFLARSNLRKTLVANTMRMQYGDALRDGKKLKHTIGWNENGKDIVLKCETWLIKLQCYIQKKNVKILSHLGVFALAYALQLATPLQVVAAIFRKKSSVVIDAPEVVTVAKKSGFVSLMTKILQGANVSGDFRTWKAGDTRTEFAALLNTVSGFAILGFLAFIGYIQHNYREMKMNKAMEKELIKITEYKENMYFEAVQDVISKLANPKTKGSTKANLQKQLKDLDPDGTIQKFLESGSKEDRPDISHIINRKSKKSKKTTSKSASKSKPASSSLDKESKSNTKKPIKNITYDDDDEEEAIGFQDEPVEEIKPVAKNTPAYKRVLDELYNSLDGVLSKKERAALVSFLESRIESISDSTKQSSTVTKIAERLGDDEYWIKYSNKLGQN